MADPKRVDSGGGLSGIADLLKLFGGTQTSTQSTANIGPLQGVLAQLQGVDPTAQLQTIMQTLAGQTPGLAARYGNAVGARSGGNGVLQANLDKLLSDATVKAQQQIAQQQQQNLATQGQVASAIAQGTQGQKSQSGTNLANAAKGLGALQAVGSVMNSDLFKKGKSAVMDFFGSGNEAAGGLTDVAAAPELSSLNGLFDFSAPELTSGISDFASVGDAGATIGDAYDFYGGSGGDAGQGLWDSVTDFFGFADGGLVGRDGIRVRRNEEAEEAADPTPGKAAAPKKTSSEEDDPDLAAMKRANAKRNPKTGRALDEYDRSSNMVDKKTGIRFADGGMVRSAGGRRSSAPTYDPVQVLQSIAQQGRGVLNPFIGGLDGGLGRGLNLPGMSDAMGSDVAATPAAGFTGPLGQAVAQNQQDVASAFAQAMLGQALGVPGIGKSPMGFAQTLLGAGMQEQSMLNALNAAEDPIAATAVAVGALSPSAAMGLGSNTLGAAANAVAAATGVDTMDALMGLTDSFGTGPGANGPGVGIGTNSELGGYFGSDPSDGAVGSDDGGLGSTAGSGNSGGDDGAGEGSGDGSSSSSGDYANGGSIRGPGTGTSDSIHAHLSDGEYVISADVVNRLGVDFFDNLQKTFHSYTAPGA